MLIYTTITDETVFSGQPDPDCVSLIDVCIGKVFCMNETFERELTKQTNNIAAAMKTLV